MSHVLVVDDEELARYTLREMLEAAGHRVSEASNGVTGMEAVADCDLVITDIIMPDKEGIAFIKELKAAWPGRPVIAVSGGGRTHNLDFLDIVRQFGADGVLSKPFTAADLAAVMQGIGFGDGGCS